MGTVLAAAGGGVGWGQRVSARRPAQRAQTAKNADFSFARCARGQFSFARCALTPLLRSQHLSYLRRGDSRRASEGIASDFNFGGLSKIARKFTKFVARRRVGGGGSLLGRRRREEGGGRM